MPPRLPDLVNILEAVYAVDRDEMSWLRGVVDAVRPAIEMDLGVAAYTYDTTTRPLTVRAPILDCPLDANGLSMLMNGSSEDYVQGSWLSQSVALASETPGFAQHPGVRDVFAPLGIRDVLVINAVDAAGVGCLVGAPLKATPSISRTDRERWERVAVHVRSALRLRLRMSESSRREEGGTGDVEAVLDRSGKIEHVSSAAAGARESLRDAVLNMERVRRSTERRSDGALTSWKALVRARWTVVDDFENDGRHYLVARANGPVARGSELLSRRERQILTALSMGQSQKSVAYELGLSPSSVRVLLARARAKLGVKTNAALLAKFNATEP